jgi:hypothetical protein
MGDGETLSAIQKVVAARQLVDEAQENNDYPPDVETILDNAVNALQDASDLLALADLSQSIAQLKKDSQGLANISNQIQKSLASLQKIAQAVSVAATALGAVAQVVAAAASGGLLH